jgi:hypothetical protein
VIEYIQRRGLVRYEARDGRERGKVGVERFGGRKLSYAIE